MPKLELAAIFNFFASLFAVGLYAYCSYAHPTQVIGLPAWYYFLGAAIPLTVVFFVVFLYHRDRVKSGAELWPVVVNFVLYISIFATLTTGFGILKIFEPYLVIQGVVVDEAGNGLGNVDVEVSDQQTYVRSGITDGEGRFIILVDKTRVESLTRAVMTSSDGARERQITFSGGFSAPLTMRRITLPLPAKG
jgi:hypothetical protein